MNVKDIINKIKEFISKKILKRNKEWKIKLNILKV